MVFRSENSFTKLADRFFGDRARRRLSDYYELGQKLQQAMINIPPDVYVATQMLFSIALAAFGLILGAIVAIIVYLFVEIPTFDIYFPEPFLSFWLAYRKVFISLFLAVFLGVLFFMIGQFIFAIYPGYVASDRKSKIDRLMPNAVMFMYSLSSGGMPLIQIFKSIASYEDVYSELAKEFSRIILEIEELGHDLVTTLTKAVELTPSKNLADLLQGLITIIESGGDFTSYFRERSDYYLEMARQDQKSFLEFLSLMGESYITAFVAGPLFLIIIQTVMAVMGESDVTLLYAVVYMIIPVGAFFFAFIIKLLTPVESGKAPVIQEKHVLRREIDEDVMKKWNSWKMRKRLNPKELFIENPPAVFLISIPLAVAFALFGIMQYTFSPTIDWFFLVDDNIFISIVIALLPYAVVYQINKRRTGMVLKFTPVFLNRIASMNESGMNITRAIRTLAKTDTTPLRKEIEKINRDLEWNISLVDALIRFANRLRTFELTRTTILLVESLRSTPNVTEILRISAKDASNAELLRRERIKNMSMYVMIIYISFFVFIGIVYIISTTFLSVLAESTSKVAAAGGGFMSMGSIDEEFYKGIFMHAAVFQGLFAGLVAGVMGEGDFSSGVKHSLIMLIFAYVLFTVFI
ncbi:type II secretion system F family protein [Geoglobus acetivorans]|uniref:Type II secretion system F family protein n=1 Tax=Geoglobus acetivorans TaxID=565033 RepID=A0ABZ3H2J9_GEOAI|nr:type II secretion system F family protein [Geoglobus acetivorans]